MREALYFRNISFSAKLHSEADVSKYGQIRPHIRRPYLARAGYKNMAGFRPGPRPDMISGATLVTNHVCVHEQSTQATHQQNASLYYGWPDWSLCTPNVNLHIDSPPVLRLRSAQWLSYFCSCWLTFSRVSVLLTTCASQCTSFNQSINNLFVKQT